MHAGQASALPVVPRHSLSPRINGVTYVAGAIFLPFLPAPFLKGSMEFSGATIMADRIAKQLSLAVFTLLGAVEFLPLYNPTGLGCLPELLGSVAFV